MNRKKRAWLAFGTVGLMVSGFVATGVALASSASAHTPRYSASCDGVSVNLTDYQQGSNGRSNTVKVVVGGDTKVDTTFNTSYSNSWSVPQEGASTTWSIDVTAWDGSQYNLHKSGTVGPCGQPDTSDKKISFCHATPADTAANGWNLLTTSVNAFYQSGHPQHAADIVPPFSYVKHGETINYPGLNWDAEGQSIYNSGCTKPVTKITAPEPVVTPPTCDVAGSVSWPAFEHGHWTNISGTGPGSQSATPVADNGYELTNPGQVTVEVQPKLPSDQCLNEVPAPEVPVVDECGPDNAHYGDVPEGPYSVVRNDDGSITLTANEGYIFPHQKHQVTLPAPQDSNEPCPSDQIDIPAAPSSEDPCGPNNATWNVPDDTDTLHWAVSDAGHLVVSIVADNVEFTDGTLMHDFGVAPESNEACPTDDGSASVKWECDSVTVHNGRLTTADVTTAKLDNTGHVVPGTQKTQKLASGKDLTRSNLSNGTWDVVVSWDDPTADVVEKMHEVKGCGHQPPHNPPHNPPHHNPPHTTPPPATPPATGVPETGMTYMHSSTNDRLAGSLLALGLTGLGLIGMTGIARRRRSVIKVGRHL